MRTARTQLILWGCMALYVFAAPSIYDRYIATNARPEASDSVLPPFTDLAKVGVDAFEVNDAQQGIYQIVGWGFPMVETSDAAGDYERKVVLSSSTHNYVFPAKTGKRKDVRDYFKSLGMDVQMSGFLAYMNQHTIEPGTYAVGLIFTKTGTDEAHYVATGRCLTRTPNSFILEDAAKRSCPGALGFGVGKPVQSGSPLPPRKDASELGIDAVTRLDKQTTIHQVVGWGFAKDDLRRPAGDYQRELALISPSRHYVFEAATVARPDVQQYFSSLGMDLTQSGFSAYVDAKDVEPGVYSVALILKDLGNDELSLVDKAWCVGAADGELKLLPRDSAECASLHAPASVP